MNKYSFEVITPTENDWQEVESCLDATVFHTYQWNRYLSTLNRKPFCVAVSLAEGNERIGFFLGTKRWLGIRIVGAPGGGTGTFVQGLCLKMELQIEERLGIYSELVKYCQTHHLAGYIQISDWQLMTEYPDMDAVNQWSIPFLDQMGIHYSLRTTLFINTRLPEEELWANLKYKSCKYPINKAKKLGLYVKCIEKAEEIPSFVDTLSLLIDDVSRRKKEKRHVHHSKKYLLALCESLFPDRILLLQVMGKDDDGVERVMASSVFCIGKEASTYFSGASNENYMKYCPNELMVWEAMRILHQKGAGDLILGGVASYKKKFGSTYALLPMMVFTKYAFLKNVRVWLKKTYKIVRNSIK